MATIKILFDNQNNPIVPTLLLANRNGNRLGQITNVSNIFISDALNDTPELTFKVSKLNGDDECHLWDKIIDFKLLYCIEWDTWFEIKVELSDGQETVKSVTATGLCQSELSQIMIFGTEINTEDDIARDEYEIPTVVYNEGHPEASLLHRITEKAPHYKIKHVDESLQNIQRTFSFDGKSIKDALDEIAEEIKCLIIYGNELDPMTNSPARTISLYDLEKNCLDCGYRGSFSDVCPECGSSHILKEYGDDTTIFVTNDNLTDEITLSSDTDSVKNCFKLEAGDDLMTATIKNCNPNGSSYIWYFSDETKADMPKELSDKINSYDDVYAEYQTSHVVPIDSSLLADFNTLIQKYKVYNEDLEEIKSPVTGYSNLMNALYETIDMELYLDDGLMPTYKMADTTAMEQTHLLTTSSLSPIGVANIETISAATADSYVLDKAKVIVDSRYRVKIKTSTFDKSSHRWGGVFTVTNYSDEEDTADSSAVTLTITGNYEQYIKQKIEKALSKGDTENYSITGLFEKPIDSFVQAIKQYGLQPLKSIHDCCQGCLDILVEQGVSDATSWSGSNPNLYNKFYMDYYHRLQALEKEMALREKEIGYVTALTDSIESERQKIQETLNFENYIGKDLWKVFCSYRRDDLYSNNNYVSDGLSNAELFKNAREFIDTAEKEIFKSANLQHSITATLKNLLVIKEFQKLVEYFAVGNWIRIEVDEIIYKLRLLKYEIDYEDLSNINVDFSDVEKIRDGVSDAESVLSQAASIATSYDSVKRQANKGNDSFNTMSRWHQEGMDATYAKFMNDANSQDMIFDSHGMLFRKHDDITGNFLPTQLKIINSTIAITADNWKSTKTAIGNFVYKDPKTGELTEAYGINGEVICGKLLLGESLGIYNSSGSLSFDKNGFIITNGKNTFSVNPNNANKLLCLSNKNKDLLYVDEKGSLHVNAEEIDARVEKNGVIAAINASSETVTINANKINLKGYVTFTNLNTAGQTSINGANIMTGTVTANKIDVKDLFAQNIEANGTITGLTLRGSKGEIGCWNITADRMYDATNTAGYTGVNRYGAGQAFWAGGTDLTGNNAPFRVNHNGKFVSTDAEITGAITATSGKIGNFNLNEGWLSADVNGDGTVDYALKKDYFCARVSNEAGAEVASFYADDYKDFYGNIGRAVIYGNGSVNIRTGGSIYFDYQASSIIKQLIEIKNNGSIDISGALSVNAVDGTSGAVMAYALQTSTALQFINTGGSISSSADGLIFAAPIVSDLNYEMTFGVHNNMRRLYPNRDGGTVLGAGDYRWQGLCAVNGTIATSDEREKDIIGKVDDRYLKFFEAIDPILYRWNYGNDKRIRVGIGAQSAEKALRAAGLTLDDFAGISHDYFDKPTANGLTDRYGMDYDMYNILAAVQTKRNTSSISELKSNIESLQHQLNDAFSEISKLASELANIK